MNELCVNGHVIDNGKELCSRCNSPAENAVPPVDASVAQEAEVAAPKSKTTKSKTSKPKTSKPKTSKAPKAPKKATKKAKK